jgi:Zn-dependent peptidase ImmA (M78 family)/transcriptional regulator with XRE-family HTH domain
VTVTVRVPVQSGLLTWARERSGASAEDVLSRFPSFDDWAAGRTQPTLKQLEKFAQVMHVPIGYLLLPEPPEEALPVPDFRTMADARIHRASPDLLETVYQCQQRQDWYRDYARVHRESTVPFVGSITDTSDVGDVAARMREVFSFTSGERGATWSEALRRLIESADQRGVLVMVSGIVGSNTHRKLDPREFRGFALADELAPVVFINGADTKAAQIFTLAHELVHLWLGESGVDDVDMGARDDNATERFCNAVAAEFLLPAGSLTGASIDLDRLTDELERLARDFKVSTLVALRRLFDLDYLTWSQYRAAYAEERDRVLVILEQRSASGGGGNFYNTQPLRVSKRFARALIESTREGQTLHRDAFAMLGLKKVATFNELALRLGAG